VPNKPKTPNRSFRLDEETVTKMQDIQQSIGTTNLSDTVRSTVQAMHVLGEAMRQGLPEGISLDAVAAADEASWLNAFMPDPEASRRLVAALVAAKPYLEAESRADERQKTLRDVITRLEGWSPKSVDPMVIAHLRSLLD
jgi:hypothetical protein